MNSVSRRAAIAGAGCAAIALSAGPAFARKVRPDLYNCEGCEAVGERAREMMSAIVDLAGADEPGARLVLEGVVTNLDGMPAKDIIIYAHHTNAAGLYADGSTETTWSRRHGKLRGWALTGADGAYRFNTIKPAPYPDMTMPAHIHLTVGETGRLPYYIDDVVFDGEFGVTKRYRDAQEFRGGSGIVTLEMTAGGAWLARRNISLEAHPA
jgi:protocatechuate 3,4-dioxygenase beta subunit